MNQLWVRLTLAFILVTMIAIGTATALTNLQISSQFRRFVAHNQMMDSPLINALTEYYAKHDNWDGVKVIFDPPGGRGMGGMGMGMGRRRSMMLLADANGQTVYDQVGTTPRFSLQQQTEAVILQWEGKTIGYLLITSSQLEMNPMDKAFLEQVNLAFMQAALIAGSICGLLGFLIARELTAPLGRLAAAVRRITQGELGERVLIEGANEIAHLARDFNEMAQSLQQAEILRRNMVADVAHELRTPLTIIQGNLQAILDDVYPLDKTEIATIYNETLMLNRLVKDMRDLAQAEAGQLSLNLHPMEIASLIQETADFFESLAQEQYHHLEISLPNNLPSVLADSDRVRQVLHNLLTNALRHTPKNCSIKLRVELRQPYIKISVHDTGHGISAEDLAHVFDRFWRADKSRARQYGGSGLGLAIAKQLVEAQGGQIGVTSKAEHGSEFWFTLPLARG